MSYPGDPFAFEWPTDNDMNHAYHGDHDFQSFYDMFMDIPLVPGIDRTEEPAARGFEPVVQQFYEGPEKCDCCINWVEKQPVQMPESEKEKYERAAICVYRCKDHEREAARVGGLIALKYNRIVIQSQLLINTIRPTLAQAGVKIPDRGDLEFRHPFRELYFSYENLVKLSASQNDESDERKLLELLKEVMTSSFVDLSAKVSSLRSKGTTDYESLWTLYPKGMVVYEKLTAIERLMRVLDVEPIMHPYKTKDKGTERDQKIEIGLRIRCESLAFNGASFGVIKDSTRIEKFEGESKVTSLPIYPVGFHTDKKFWQNCTERGRKLLDLQSVVHCGYEGSAGLALEYGKYSFVSGRVIIDPYRFYRTHLDEAPIVEKLEDDTLRQVSSDNYQGFDHSNGRLGSAQVSKLGWIDEDSERRPSLDEQNLNRKYFEERPHLLMLLEPCVQGFSLTRNGWYNLHLSKLRDIEWVPNPLDGLIFDVGIKKMLASFSKHHTGIADPVAGPLAAKGQGLVVLLSGPSGTGKTLTAEVVAEENKLPLYRVMAGQLGSLPAQIEEQLAEVLELALTWNCVVLIDEADTFIRSRTSSDRVTNEIVSIFLRRLEYFQGIIFLTTNMPHDIDDAFRSRCRLHIPYQALDSASREQIWEINFTKAGLERTNGSRYPFGYHEENSVSTADPRKHRTKLIISKDDLQDLVLWQLSGREIQNVVQNVALWCKTDNAAVTAGKLRTSIQMTVPYAKRQADSMTLMDNVRDSGVERPQKRPRLTSGPNA